MTYNLPVCELGTAPLEIIDGDRGKNYPTSNEFLEKGFCLFLNTGNVTSSGFRFEQCSFISKEKDQALRKGKLQRNDAVLTTRGTIGNVAFYGDDVPFENVRINSGMVILRANNALLSPRYLYIFLTSSYFKDQVSLLASGSAQPQLPIRDLRKVKILLPSRNAQEQIVEVIATLDDKIELNRKMNSTLEQLGQVLFKSWFVDFDPVRAKIEKRMPEAIDKVVASLFPDEFINSPLGLIPKGWQSGSLKDLIEEGTKRVGDKAGATVFSAVQTGNLIRSEEQFTKRVFSLDTSKYKLLERWNYAYNPSRINIGSIGMLEENIVGAVSPVYVVFRVVIGYEWWLRFFIRLKQTREIINQLCSGSVRQSLTFRDLASIPLVIPPPEIVEAFTQKYLLLRETQISLNKQNNTLTTIRNISLSKLISGEITLKP